VLHTEEVLTRMGARVTARLYPGMGHTINQDEIAEVKAIMSSASHA
jgi:predicted esterase